MVWWLILDLDGLLSLWGFFGFFAGPKPQNCPKIKAIRAYDVTPLLENV